MDYEFEVTDQLSRPTLSIRSNTAIDVLPQKLCKAYEAIIQYLNEIGEKPKEAAYAGYFNMDMENLDVEMGFLVDKPLPGKGEIRAGEIPAGKQVSYLYKGPYEGMVLIYNAMNQWMEKKGYIPTGVSYEFYYNSPAEVPAKDLLTKIVLPIK